MSNITLTGLHGDNPLAYLAALGTLRLLSTSFPNVRLGWIRKSQWLPVLSGLNDLDAAQLSQALIGLASAPLDLFKILGKDITAPPNVFRTFAEQSVATSNLSSHAGADFAASFGNELRLHDKLDRIQFTSLCFITGSGHQHFLGTLADLRAQVQPSHLADSLFNTWTHQDRGLSFRWDPSDAREYALRWNDPGPEGVWSQWGANWLAFEALPLFPSQPTTKYLETTGFRESKQFEDFTWPIWEAPLSCDTVKSLVGLKQLCDEDIDRGELIQMGLTEIYRSQRVRIGAGRLFKVSFRPSRAL